MSSHQASHCGSCTPSSHLCGRLAKAGACDLMQALVCTWELKAVSAGARIWPNTAVWPHLSRLLQMAPTLPPKQTSKPTTAAAAAPRGSSPIDWAQLQQLLSDGQYSSTGQLHLLAGGRDALLPARYETSDRLICQVAGRQKLLLLAPGLAFKGLYPYPVAHPYDGYSCVDWEEPELGHWPAAAQVRIMCTDGTLALQFNQLLLATEQPAVTPNLRCSKA